MKFEFTKTNIEKVIQEFSNNQNFIYTVLPRLKTLYAIKKELKEIASLEWHVEFEHTNINRNRVFIIYKHNKSEDLAFSYEIPLSQKFELRAFLANSSVHFIDIYNFLLERKIIDKDQFPLKAEYHTIPHFILNGKVKRFDLGVINKNIEISDLNKVLVDEKIKTEIEENLKVFNSIFEETLNHFKF